jgi:hypothetical protein
MHLCQARLLLPFSVLLMLGTVRAVAQQWTDTVLRVSPTVGYAVRLGIGLVSR